VQESLTNALRHVDAGSAEAVLCYTADRLGIRVTDDGRVDDTGPKKGAGLGRTGMQERAALLGVLTVAF
jgi:signal transduction histidine kinase